MILYKYYNFNAGISALQSQRLGFREPFYFNDPFELSYLDDGTDRGVTSTQMLDLKKSLVVLSLTKTPLNPLMWAHYGEDHKGFVVGYDVEDDFFQSEEYNLITANKGSVIYTSNKGEIVSPEEFEQIIYKISMKAKGENFDSSCGDMLQKITNVLEKLLLYKHSSWEYEEEVRVVKIKDSLFEETHIFQSNPNRKYSPISKSVAPSISAIQVDGLCLFTKQAKIKEVYLGMRNPLLNSNKTDQFQNTSISDLAKEFEWSVNKVSMASGSWGLQSTGIGRDQLLIPKKNQGLLHSFSFDGSEAKFLSDMLPKLPLNEGDQFEVTNWCGELNLKENGKFIL